MNKNTLSFKTGGDKRYSTNAVLSPSLTSSNIGLSSTNLAASTFHLVQLLARSSTPNKRSLKNN
ncbi:hypothetical protein ARMGADRAFT_1083644 [Armillaria gallica]|uniref:Uncharacterized protein n=1 Tax=Armillaria gallica TaxID=47427 RepID=A0A2H3DKS6_ARMGA|nr:hypothetical protein ARMGADRAFT_1083644 [Armillaria gallica]